ncbi:hypothetical protein VP01_11919g1 [Puccinia sorghi]|uniref:Uncharacterized protein n=1 Tax=Puccinia sorghi TaxID=27349 RepID=A0A0L6VSA4_9BASI|nr:hypothetical protein VP01_11919g1 [Puccinia sorghi]
MAPKGLPINFYIPKWFLGLVYSQKQSIPDMTCIGFLPNAKQSLLPKPHTHPDNKLANSTFTNKYWEVAKLYGLLDPDSSDNEADRSKQNNQSNEEGEGIDLTQPSDGFESNDCYKEGEEGDLYNEEEDGFVVSGSGEEGSGDGEGKDENEDDDEDDKAEDGDYTMHEIPEGE